MTRRKKPAGDPRQRRVLTILDDLSCHNAEHDDAGAPDLDDLAIEMFTAAVRGCIEVDRMNQFLALLWKDNDNDNYSDEETRRGPMSAIAERAHRYLCRCCRDAHERSAAAPAKPTSAEVH